MWHAVSGYFIKANLAKWKYHTYIGYTFKKFSLLLSSAFIITPIRYKETEIERLIGSKAFSARCLTCVISSILSHKLDFLMGSIYIKRWKLHKQNLCGARACLNDIANANSRAPLALMCIFLHHKRFWLKPFDIRPKAQIARLIRNNNAAPLLLEARKKWRRRRWRTPSLFAGDRRAHRERNNFKGVSTARGHTFRTKVAIFARVKIL